MKEKLLILIGRIGKEARVGKITTKVVQSNVLLYGIFPIHSVCFVIISMNCSIQVKINTAGVPVAFSGQAAKY